MTSCDLFHPPVTSFDLSCEGEFEISLAQGNFQKEGRGEVEGCRVGKKGYNEEKGRGMGNCNGKENGMEGKGEAYRYRFILGGRGGKRSEGMGRGTGNTGDGKGEVRGERRGKGRKKGKEGGKGKEKRK